jgi:hypothetical protein
MISPSLEFDFDKNIPHRIVTVKGKNIFGKEEGN